MKKYSVLIFLVVVIITAAVLVSYGSRRTIVNINNISVVVTVADEKHEWEAGLSGKENLAYGHGMLFVFPDSRQRLFWMRGMKFPIDIIWIHDGKVVGVTKNVLPPTGVTIPEAWSPEPVSKVLEVTANFSDQHRIATGTVLSIN